MKIGKLADVSGVSTSSIRFYEKNGLIPEPDRHSNGYRDYPEATISRLKTITMSKSLGFSLSEIRGFLPDNPQNHMERADVISNLEKKLSDVDHQMQQMRKIRKKLVDMIEYMSDPESKSC